MSWSPVVHKSAAEASAASQNVELPPSPPDSDDETASWLPVVYKSAAEARAASENVALPPSPPPDSDDETASWNNVVGPGVDATIYRNLESREDRASFAEINRQSREAAEYVNAEEEKYADFARHCDLLDRFKRALEEQNEDDAAELMLALLREPQESHFLKMGGFRRMFGGRDVFEDITSIDPALFRRPMISDLIKDLTIGKLVDTMIANGRVDELAEAICTNITENITFEFIRRNRRFIRGMQYNVFRSALLPAVPLSDFRQRILNYPDFLCGSPVLLTFGNGRRELHFCDVGDNLNMLIASLSISSRALFTQDGPGAAWQFTGQIGIHRAKYMVLTQLLMYDARAPTQFDLGNWKQHGIKHVHLRASFTDACLC